MNKAIVYVAVGDEYVREALRSAGSLRRHMPDVPVCLLTDQTVESPHLTQVICDPTLAGAPRAKLHLDRVPFDRVLYLDSDTHVAGDLAPVFALLDRFDFAAHQYSSGYHYNLPGVPNTFPEFNSGVLAFRRCEAIAGFFAAWRRSYAALSRGVDQPALRLALYESGLRIAALPPEYNFMPYFPNYATDRVRVLHGRPHERLVALEREMNRRVCYRFYSPGLGCTPVREAMSLADTARLAARALVAGGSQLVKRPLRRWRRRKGA